MTSSSGSSDASSSNKFADVLSPSGTILGDVILFNDGRASVMNGWSGLQQWFDDPSTGHKDALWYIYTRICDTPIFSDKIFEDADITEVKKKIAEWHSVSPNLWCNDHEDAIYKVPSDEHLMHIEAALAEGTAIKYVPEVLATIDIYTEDGIVGRATCMNCGKVVRRYDRYCWHCGAVLTNSASNFGR